MDAPQREGQGRSGRHGEKDDPNPPPPPPHSPLPTPPSLFRLEHEYAIPVRRRRVLAKIGDALRINSI